MIETITKESIKSLFSPMRRDAHKGTAGRVLLVAGSPGMAGAAVLAARGALRSGAGLVRVSIERELWPIVQIGEPCATCVDRAAFDEAEINRYDAVAIGPGLGTGGRAADALARVLERYKGKLVLDADALNLLPTTVANVRSSPKRILTPHPGEAARLLGVDTKTILADRRAAASALATRFGAVAVLKGHATLVAIPAHHHGDESASEIAIRENTTGNPGMGTAGSGDVLTGVIAAFAGRGLSAAQAAQAGVFVHGLAGDMAAQRVGEYGLTASDIAAALPLALKSIVSFESR
jgi:NAD(P)H-hydrate epimerase